MREALSEIEKVRRKDAALSAESAVPWIERLSPALEQVDGSSGAMGYAVNRAIEQSLPILGYEISSGDVHRAWRHASEAAERAGRAAEAVERLRASLSTRGSSAEFVRRHLPRVLGEG